MDKPKTAGLRWFGGSSQRLGRITQAWFTEDGILRLEIDCNYDEVSHYSVVLDRQSKSDPLQYFGRWSSNSVHRSVGEVDVRLTSCGSDVFRLAGNWHDEDGRWDWESTSEIVIETRL